MSRALPTGGRQPGRLRAGIKSAAGDGLGVAGFYLGLLTSASFAWRRWLGQRFWRALHSLTFLAYLLVTVHGVAAGTDSGTAGMRLLYVASGLAVLFLINFRLLSKPARRR